MIPSRGLRWSGQHIGVARRRVDSFSVRQFSSSTVQHGPIRGNPLLAQTRASMPSKFLIPRSNILIRTAAASRFASTTPTSTTPDSSAATSPGASPLATTPSELVTDLDNTTDLTTDVLSNLPEQIGYLKGLGLDYGYGPTAMMEFVLEHIHVYAGTPWWATIGLSALLVRTVLFKLYINASDNATRMNAVKPITKPLTDQMMNARAMGDVETMMRLKGELQRINKRAGISYYSLFAPLGQGIAAYGTFVILRNMAKLPVPGLETGGLLWFYNLTIPDPLFLLPVATAGIIHWTIRKGGEMGTSTLKPEMQQLMTWGFPAMSLAFTWWFPAAVQLTFFYAAVISFIQAAMMRKTWFRTIFKMTPLPTKPTGSSPYRGTIKIAAPSPVLSQAELNSRFKSTSSSFPRPPESGIRKLLSTAIKPLEKPFEEFKESTSGMMNLANERLDKRREKNERSQAARYETKRKEELKKMQELVEQQEKSERRARRMMKKK